MASRTKIAASALYDPFKSPKIWLRPISNSEEFDYFFSLMKKYKYERRELNSEKITFKFARHIWIGSTESLAGLVRGGVIYLQHFPDKSWSLDAYRDDLVLKAIDIRGDFSFRAGRLVIDWFLRTYPGEELWTAHDTRNRAATQVCERLNFSISEIVKTKIGEFVLMRLDRNLF